MSEVEAKKVVVLPGDAVPVAIPEGGALATTSTSKSHVRVGPGLHQTKDGVIATKAGLLKRITTAHAGERYVPQTGESVIGIITAKGAENYRVDIGSAHPASLGVLAFEGATKRNKPNFEVGALVYARVSIANKDMEPELDCINPISGRADGFSELKGGFMFKCSLGLCRSLLIPGNPFVAALGKMFKFEMAVGINGRVWVNAVSTRHVVAVTNAIRGAEGLPSSRIKEYLKTVEAGAEDAME